MNVLEKICADKLDYVERCRRLIPDIVYQEKAKLCSPPRGFCNVIRKAAKSGQPALIAEIKKASPSKGIIRPDFNPIMIALSYQNAGASCISVLTDRPYFKGSDEDLQTVKSVTRIPVLRKDFMISPFQIYESRALGADCILLIMAALSDEAAREMYNLATSLGMDVLVEVHDRAELDRALKLEPMMIGVNARSLKTLEVDLATSFDLIKNIPSHILRVAESGISSHNDLKSLFDAGYNAFLVGESLMRENDIEQAVQKLLGKAPESE